MVYVGVPPVPVQGHDGVTDALENISKRLLLDTVAG
jgi:hypothetical protein